jgi:chorismate mutase
MTDAPDPAALAAARAEIDALDEKLLALVGERAAIAARIAAAKGADQGSPLRPAREVRMLRRLIAQAPSQLSPALVVEVWRALIADNLGRQRHIDVFVGGGPDPLRLFDLARRHFGASARIVRAGDQRQTLDRMTATPASAAVLPFPGRSGAGSWWSMLTEGKYRDAVLVAALPMREDGAEPEAAVITRGAPLEEAGADTTLAIAFDPHFKLTRGINESGLPAREAARTDGRVLIHIDGFVGADDARLVALARAGVDQPRVVGCFARV